MKTIIGVNGACGRMGQRIIQLAHEDKSLSIGAALEANGHPQLGHDAGEVAGLGAIGAKVSSSVPLDQRLDVIIDFSLPQGTMNVLGLCLERAKTAFPAKPKAECRVENGGRIERKV